MSEEVLKALAHRTNQAILNLLTVEPTYPRKIGDLLSLSETEVARRLRKMEKLGLLESDWAYIGKNVKMYKLVTNKVVVEVAPEGMRIHMGGDRERDVTLNPFKIQVPSVEGFVGRGEELATLDAATVVVVEGMPGIGKTSLLAHWAAGREPLFWHTFRGVESLNWLANRLGVFLAQHGHGALLEAVEAGHDLADVREALLRSIQEAKLPIVLDDVHRIEDPAMEDLITDAIEQTTSGKLVVGARERPAFNPTAGHVSLLQLAGLDDEAVRDVCRDHAMEIATDLVARVREEVGGHPLALMLFLETAKELQVGPEALLDRIPEQNLEEYLLQEIYNALAQDERTTLAHASLFRSTFTARDLRALSSKRVEGPLLRLRRRMLVQVQEDQYSLHEVVRNFFYNLLQDKKRLHGKLAAHFLSLGTLEGRLEAMHHHLEAGDRRSVLKHLQEDLDLQEFDLIDAGYQSLYMDILQLFDRDEVTDDRTWALIQDEKGDILFHRGEYEGAMGHYDQAAELFGSDPGRQADVAWKKALALQRLGRAGEARSLCEDALKNGVSGQEKERLERLLQEI